MSRGFALFMAWFNGICAPVCGLWMSLSAIFPLPVSWNDLMPISLLSPLPIPEFMKADFFWSGIALTLVNGIPNVLALILRFQGKRRAFYVWGIVAGLLLIAWTVFEMIFIPNGISLFYLALGILQLIANIFNLKNIEKAVEIRNL